MKYIKRVIIVLSVSFGVSLICDVSFIKNNHFNLITANSVLIGFLFTSLSIMLSFLNEKVVQLFEKAGALKIVYKSISIGIEYSIYSIIISLLNMILLEKYINNNYVLNLIYSLEFMLLIFTMYYLLITIKEVKVIVESIKFNNVRTKEKEQIDSQIEHIFKND